MRVPAWRIVAGMGLLLVGSWGLVASVAFRELFRKKAWEGACGEKGGWELFAEIRVGNSGRGWLYGGAESGKKGGEKERWGTSSTVGFYSLGNATEGEELYRGRWRWEYDMDLVRRYDLPWGLGRYGNGDGGGEEGEEEEEDGAHDEDPEITTEKLLVFVLRDFAHSSGTSYLKNQTVDNDSPSNHLIDISPLFSNQTNSTFR